MAVTIQEQSSGAGSAKLQTIDALLHATVSHFPDASAFTCLGHTLDYRRLDALSRAFACWLQQASGLQPGDRVAVQLPNLLQYPVVALGVLRAGMVLVTINPLYTPTEIKLQLDSSGAALLVVLANLAHAAAGILAQTTVRQVIVTEVADLHPMPQRWIINFAARHGKKPVAAFHFSKKSGLRAVLAAGKKLSKIVGLQPVPLSDASPALLQYTGGTTGQPRAALLTHGNLLSNLQQIQASFGAAYPGPEAVIAAPLPLYHIYAFNMNMLNSIFHAHHTLLIPDPRDLPALVKAIKPYRISGFVGINTLYRIVCENAAFCALDFSRLVIASAGGMALSAQVATRWQQITGCRITEGYGMSECSPLVACNTLDVFRDGTVGKPVHGTDIKLMKPDGSDAAVGAAGEICVRGPQVMQGYWLGPDRIEPALDAQGWFHTGDVGSFDTDGFLRIVDRIKDIIIVSGFNVYPNELEEYACMHPHVQDACAISVGDEYSVQIKLFIVPGSSELTTESVLSWCRQGLAPYKVPRHIEFRDRLPKSSLGKILRRELRTENPVTHG